MLLQVSISGDVYHYHFQLKMENFLCILGIHLHSEGVSEVFENDTAIVSV